MPPTRDAAPRSPTRDEWLAEARLFRAEGAIAEAPTWAARCLIAAARAAQAAGESTEAAAVYDEALERTPGAPDALRGRARLPFGGPPSSPLAPALRRAWDPGETLNPGRMAW